LKLYLIKSKNVVDFFDILKSCKNLKILYIQRIDYEDKRLDINTSAIQSYISNSLSNYEVIKFPLLDFLNCSEVQMNNPNIRFCWYYYVNGGKYEGEYEDNSSMRHGIGTMVDNRSRYVGEWKNDMKDGKGILTSTPWSGSVYQANWRGYKRRGTDLMGTEVRYEGEWKEDKREGRGTLTDKIGVRYEGEWKNDSRSGQGKYFESNGDIYEGGLKLDARSGKGICYFKNGCKYEGEWENNKMNGDGIYIYKDGRRYEGKFKNNLKEGRGVLFHLNGSTQGGLWKKDKFVG
jgi:hypothetical protein